jgi:hypothetical protein
VINGFIAFTYSAVAQKTILSQRKYPKLILFTLKKSQILNNRLRPLELD